MGKKNGKVRGNTKEILQKLIKIPYGLNAKQIIQSMGISKTTAYRSLNNLIKLKLLKKIDNVYIPTSAAQSEKMGIKGDIELHKLSFVLDLIKKPTWWDKRQSRLLKIKEYHFKPENHNLKNNPYEQGQYNNYLIQTFSNSIVMISQKDYLGNDGLECITQGLEDFLDAITYLETKLKTVLYFDGISHVRVRSNHYNKLRDSLANKCKKEGSKFEVIIDNERRAWVDMSDPLGFETGHKKYGFDDNKHYVRFITDQLKNTPPNNTELANMLKTLIEIQKNMNDSITQLAERNKETSIALKAIIQYEANKLPLIDNNIGKSDYIG